MIKTINYEKELAKEFKIREEQAKATITLLNEGNTVPFIARYRKEATGSLDDQLLRNLNERYEYLVKLSTRKQEVYDLISAQEKMNDTILSSINLADSLREIKEIYLPFKQKRKTKASVAREKGLQELADMIVNQNINTGNIEDLASKFISEEKGVNSIKEALAGAIDIAAQQISEDLGNRRLIRNLYKRKALLKTKKTKNENKVYEMYFDYSEKLEEIPPHRILAINRGEKEKCLSVSFEVDKAMLINMLNSRIIRNKKSIFKKYLELAIADSYQRLISPSIEREYRSLLTDKAQDKAIEVFGSNLKNLLLAAPVKNKIVLGLDPAFRTGCKIAVVNEIGKVIDTNVVYMTLPHHDVEKAKKILIDLIKKHKVNIISIGNGTGSRESEAVVAQILEGFDDVYYTVVNEAGASVYSASELASKEFPEYDVALRSAVSIARRLQDPLAELVKIDPKSIGVGQYQHDVNQKRLDLKLSDVVEAAVNSVGVDLNTASVSLLEHIAGISKQVAKNIVEYREENGAFKSRNKIKEVKKLGDKTFLQCAGFLRIPSADNILDNTSVHPESYKAVGAMLKEIDINDNQFDLLDEKLDEYNGGISALAKKIDIGLPTLEDIILELKKPGRDIRDKVDGPVFKKGVLTIDDLTKDMVLKGTVRNVVDFGAFVDIGVHHDGLVHISQLSDKFITSASQVVKVGQLVDVMVMDVDKQRNRISLTMKGIKK